MQRNSFTVYYILNQQGDVVALTDQSGNVVAEYTYNAWGEILHIRDGAGHETTRDSDVANINPLRYRGYYYDTETGFYYLQSRYYDPVIHRFINADCFATTDPTDAISYNMFAYCNNNPANWVDYSGNSGEAIAAWGGGMWWLTAVDGLLPIGDIIYGVGCLACGVIELISYLGTDNVVFAANGAYDVYNSAKHGGGDFSISAQDLLRQHRQMGITIRKRNPPMTRSNSLKTKHQEIIRLKTDRLVLQYKEQA